MRMQENNLIWNCIKKSKISRNIFNQRSKRYILWKLWSIDEGIWKFFKEMKKNTFWLEKLMLLKYPYSSKLSTDVMQVVLGKPQLHVYQWV